MASLYDLSLPELEAFVEAAPKISIHYFDRDAHLDLKNALQICGGDRVPVVVFLSEDDKFLVEYKTRPDLPDDV